MSLSIVMYHYVRDISKSRYPNFNALDTKHFINQLNYMKQHHTFVSMDDVLEAACGGKLPGNAILLTFDDGYLDHYTTVFPILEKENIKAAFFPVSIVLEKGHLLAANKIHYILDAAPVESVYSMLLDEIDYYRGLEYELPDTYALLNAYAVSNGKDIPEVAFIKIMLQTKLPACMRTAIADKMFNRFVGINESIIACELYCDINQLEMMKRHGMYIGLHGRVHDRLGEMSKDEYEQDISQSLDYLSSIGFIDKKAWVMNYPYGSWSMDVAEYIRKIGCIAGLTTEVRRADIQSDDMLLLPRFNANNFPP